MRQAICICDGAKIIEQRAVAGLPQSAAQHAELCRAATSHVVAAFLELNHRFATTAALPAIVPRRGNQLVRLFVFWTLL